MKKIHKKYARSVLLTLRKLQLSGTVKCGTLAKGKITRTGKKKKKLLT